MPANILWVCSQLGVKRMRILVDSDACPVKDIIWKNASTFNIPVIWVASIDHDTDFPRPSQIVQVDRGPEATDLAIINRTKPGDLVVTQDYGLAAMVLQKKGYALSPRGQMFNEKNMDRLLTERHLGAQIRRAGGRTRGPTKMTTGDRICFEGALQGILMQLSAEDHGENS